MAPQPDADIFTALSRGDLAALETALDQGASPNACCGKWTALQYAMHRQHAVAFDLLLQRGADINAVGEDVRSVAHLALYAGEGLAQLLEPALLAGAKTEHRDSIGRQLLHVACAFGTPEQVEIVLRYGGCVAARDDRGGTPLHWAAARSMADAVPMCLALVRAGADLEAAKRANRTPLYQAIEHCKLDNVRLLIALGASTKEMPMDGPLCDDLRRTPLECAVRLGHPQLLLHVCQQTHAAPEVRLCAEIAEAMRRPDLAALLRSAMARHEAQQVLGELDVRLS